jgi:hypothetical protein
VSAWGAKDNALLMSQGFGSWKNAWQQKAFCPLKQLLPASLFEMLQNRLDLLRVVNEKS